MEDSSAIKTGSTAVPPVGQRDFGEYIPGSPKERYARGDTRHPTEDAATRRDLWPREDPWRLIRRGITPEAALFRNEVRKCIAERSPSPGRDGEYRALIDSFRELCECERYSDIPPAIESLRSIECDPDLVSPDHGSILSREAVWYVVEAERRGYTESRDGPQPTVVKGWVSPDGSFSMEKGSEDSVESYGIMRDGALVCTYETLGAASDALSNGSGSKRPFRLHEVDVSRSGGRRFEGHASPEDILSLGIRGVQFGNWLTAHEYIENMDNCHSAFVDLADVLGIPVEGVGLDGLGLTFGSRGNGSAMAHYEPSIRVINLTRNKGSGCLAHEFAHALDHSIGTRYGDGTHASRSKGMPDAFKHVMECITTRYEPVSDDHMSAIESDFIARVVNILIEKPELASKLARNAITHCSYAKSHMYAPRSKDKNPWIEDIASTYEGIHGRCLGVRTCRSLNKDLTRIRSKRVREIYVDGVRHIPFMSEYLVGSRAFGANYARNGHAYWHSEAELFARAFDCYVTDKLVERGMASTYLTSHADSFSCTIDGRLVRAYPHGEERTRINRAFDALFEFLKDDGFFGPIGKT